MSIGSPKVTVLMPVFNVERYLQEAIESILNQTFSDFEFIIIHDPSTDITAEILQSFGDPRIKITNNEKILGLIESLNTGLGIARGEYIARMDSDDISLPERLEKQVNYLNAHPDTFSAVHPDLWYPSLFHLS
jgi:glycosyltransferase involved in cell wall biosynthesis